MIGRAHRFHGYNALRHVYSRGQTVRSPNVTLKYLINPRNNSYRAAVVVSRKVHKSAVVRNRIRRRMYEIIRNQAHSFDKPYDLVITIFSDQLANAPAEDLREQIEAQLERASIVHRAVPADDYQDLKPMLTPANSPPKGTGASRVRPISLSDDIVNTKEH